MSGLGLRRCLENLTRPADVAEAEFWAGVFGGLARSAREWRAPELAERAEATAKGFTFRAEELRYDTRGGMTEELARRRFEPGAAWSVRGWWTGVVLERNGERVLFSEGYAEHIPYMTRENGWLFLGLSDANGGHVPPGGWP